LTGYWLAFMDSIGNMDEQIEFSGDYRSWSEAASLATGYDQRDILEKVVSATLAVKTGKAKSQRDGILLEENSHNFPLITTLLSAALADGNRLNVLDFGGSLGSSYFDSRSFIEQISEVNWSIVEQAHFVAAGKEHVASNELHFFETIEDCARVHRPNVVILSGVLQYLPDPWGTLQGLQRLESLYLFVDRTAFTMADADRLTIQHIPGWDYSASIPAWFFSQDKFLKRISDSNYGVVSEFQALDHYSLPGAQVAFKGFICKKISAPSR
jgi:putative methyltransferase (TIGR04325 family)